MRNSKSSLYDIASRFMPVFLFLPGSTHFAQCSLFPAVSNCFSLAETFLFGYHKDIFVNVLKGENPYVSDYDS